MKKEKTSPEKKSSDKHKGLGRKIGHSALSMTLTIVVIAAVVLANVVVTMFFDRYPLTVDMTGDNRYTISEQSLEYVRKINTDVKVTVFADEKTFENFNYPYNKQASELLKNYCRENHKISYRFVDMDSNGIAELLIGTDKDEYQQKFIYDMFTLVDGVPRRVLISSERVFYKLCPDHQILHHGSGGAAYNFEVIYNYSGTDLVMTSGIVNAGDDVYYEIVGETENIFDERLPGDTPITREEYFARAEAMDATTIPLQLQPFV